MEEYPLDQLVAIKQKRLEEAEKVLAEKKNILAQEEQKLATLEKKRDEVKEHYKAKLAQLREKLDEGTGTEKIQQMKQYLKLVTEELKVEEQKVQTQIKVVATAQQQVDLARQDLFKKQKDVEKLKIHHKEWQKEAHRIEEQKESVFNDESGSAMHTLKKAEKKRRNRGHK
ncbi:MAG TPA: type III secretion T3S chaperone [Rhabdochlamydiaceae bacterium]|nr:type III secretion T3S chaperone [Rhabdochlamydiaceae bacterium]